MVQQLVQLCFPLSDQTWQENIHGIPEPGWILWWWNSCLGTAPPALSRVALTFNSSPTWQFPKQGGIYEAKRNTKNPRRIRILIWANPLAITTHRWIIYFYGHGSTESTVAKLDYQSVPGRQWLFSSTAVTQICQGILYPQLFFRALLGFGTAGTAICWWRLILEKRRIHLRVNSTWYKKIAHFHGNGSKKPWEHPKIMAHVRARDR